MDTTITDKVVNSSIVHKLDQFTPTTEKELERIIRDCPAKTCSLDHCPTDVLKKTLQCQLSYLVTLVNSSFDDGIFPLKIRTAVVKPLLKKDNLDLNVFKNYRPVSNIPFISKVLEKVAVKRLTNHLDINGLQEDYQSAYKLMHSTETALLKVKHDISSALDRHNSVLFVMLDLSAAFDTIDQNQLLGLLRDEYGITGKALSWFSTYLEDRTQRVQVETTTSDHVPLKCGVPQGSVLGPVIFTLYTAPIRQLIRKHGVKHHKYADDIQLYVEYDPAVPGAREEAIRRLEACIKEIRIWMSIRMLKLNDDKTQMVIFCSKHDLGQYGHCTINIGDSSIIPVSHVHNFGVQMDDHLSMISQVTAICAACNFQLYRLSSVRRYLTVDATKNAVQALITSRLDYCNSLLLNLPTSQIARLQRIQNKAARLVTRISMREHITPVLKELHWLPIDRRIVYKVLVITYKALHGLAPVYLAELLAPRGLNNCLRGANTLTLHQPIAQKKVGEGAFGFGAPHLWNGLPKELRASGSLPQFKKLLKTHMFWLNDCTALWST